MVPSLRQIRQSSDDGAFHDSYEAQWDRAREREAQRSETYKALKGTFDALVHVLGTLDPHQKRLEHLAPRTHAPFVVEDVELGVSAIMDAAVKLEDFLVEALDDPNI